MTNLHLKFGAVLRYFLNYPSILSIKYMVAGQNGESLFISFRYLRSVARCLLETYFSLLHCF
jgi:hypothetical protein